MEKPQVIEALCRATDEVFSTMVNLTVTPGTPQLARTPPANMDGVVSFVGLAGPLVGLGSINCSGRDACAISSRLLMADLSSIDEEVLDAIGEITNMVIGAFKQQLEEAVGAMTISIPTVIYGHNFTAKHLGDDDWVVVPFDSEAAKFQVHVCLTPKPAEAHSHVAARPAVPILR